MFCTVTKSVTTGVIVTSKSVRKPTRGVRADLTIVAMGVKSTTPTRPLLQLFSRAKREGQANFYLLNRLQVLWCDRTRGNRRFSTVHEQKTISGLIRTASAKLVKAKSEGASEFQLSGGTGSVKLDRFLYVPKIPHSLVSVTGLYNDGHSV